MTVILFTFLHFLCQQEKLVLIEHLRGSIRDLQKQLKEQQHQQQQSSPQQQQSSGDTFENERKELTDKYERQTYELIVVTTAKAAAETALEEAKKKAEEVEREKEAALTKLRRVKEDCAKFVSELTEIKQQKGFLTEEWNQYQVSMVKCKKTCVRIALLP